MRAFLVCAGAIFVAAIAAQDWERPDSEEWLRLFRIAAQMSHVPPTDAAAKPSLQNRIGFTAAEMQLLNPIATDCVQKAEAVAKPKPGEVFESRLRKLQSGQDDDPLSL